MGQIREINVWKTRAFICWRLLSLKQKMHKCYSFRDSLQRNPTIINLLECLFLEFPFFLSLTSESLLFWFVLGLFVLFCFTSILYHLVSFYIFIMTFLLSHAEWVYTGSGEHDHKCPPLWPSSFPAVWKADSWLPLQLLFTYHIHYSS